MKIRGNRQELTDIVFRHGGIGVHYQQVVFPPSLYQGSNEPAMVNSAELEFSDLYEVEWLIEILKLFKEKCKENAGMWKEKER